MGRPGDRGGLRPAYACGVNNPGFGTAGYPFGTSYPVQPMAKRAYDGLELRLRKRLGRPLVDRGELPLEPPLGQLVGHQQLGRSRELSAAEFLPGFRSALLLVQHCRRPTYGLLATDRPHRFKAQGTYELPWGKQSGRQLPPRERAAAVDGGVERAAGSTSSRTGAAISAARRCIRRPTCWSSNESRSRVVNVELVGVNAINLFDQRTRGEIGQATPYRDAFNVPESTVLRRVRSGRRRRR